MTFKDYRLKNGYELTEETYHAEYSVFVIGDLHLNHTNILKYCNRPFDNVDEMNRILINNWNMRVKKDDQVFFLGDIGMGNIDKMFKSLNGKISFIRGNHDKYRDPNTMHNQLTLNYEGINFRLVHNPDGIIDLKPNEWLIHGHHHSNYPDKFPMFDRKNRKFNVSVEMIKYQPFPMSKIVKIINSDSQKIVSL